MKTLKLSILAIFITGLMLSGCKKDETETIDPEQQNDTTLMTDLSYDEDLFVRASDDVMEDIGMFLTSEKDREVLDLPCGSTLDSTIYVNDTMYYYLSFNGMNCDQTLYRKGNAIVRTDMSAIWPQAIATVHVELIGFKVIRLATGRWIILDGFHDYTNVSGGRLIHLGNGLDSIEHHTDGAVNVTFMNNTTKNWQVARAKLFTGTYPELNLETWGYGTEDEYDDLVVWGENRQGDDFFTQITLPIERRSECQWKPSAGIKIHTLPAKSLILTLTFGFDGNNNPVDPGECAEKFKLEWQTPNSGGYIYLWL